MAGALEATTVVAINAASVGWVDAGAVDVDNGADSAERGALRARGVLRARGALVEVGVAIMMGAGRWGVGASGAT